MTSSPCTGVCTLDRDGAICLGCGRTIGEIAAWATLGAAERAVVVSRAQARLAPPASAAASARR